VFIHSLVNFRLTSLKGVLTNSFELRVSFRVVNSTQFAVRLTAKYPVDIDTLNDGSVRVFIYNRTDFQNLYIRLDYKVFSYFNLAAINGSSIVKIYTAPFNPLSTNSIVFGFNGMEFHGYPTVGF
jgi:hypothetical protein